MNSKEILITEKIIRKNFKMQTSQRKHDISFFILAALVRQPSQNVCPHGRKTGTLGPIGRKSK